MKIDTEWLDRNKPVATPSILADVAGIPIDFADDMLKYWKDDA